MLLIADLIQPLTTFSDFTVSVFDASYVPRRSLSVLQLAPGFNSPASIGLFSGTDKASPDERTEHVLEWRHLGKSTYVFDDLKSNFEIFNLAYDVRSRGSTYHTNCTDL